MRTSNTSMNTFHYSSPSTYRLVYINHSYSSQKLRKYIFFSSDIFLLFNECFILYALQINNFLPERIVILRDGVSDSEMVKAASQELNSIKLAWRKCANGKKCPPFTYIVVQKNHKTRFYRQPNNENGQV